MYQVPMHEIKGWRSSLDLCCPALALTHSTAFCLSGLPHHNPNHILVAALQSECVSDGLRKRSAMLYSCRIWCSISLLQTGYCTFLDCACSASHY